MSDVTNENNDTVDYVIINNKIAAIRCFKSIQIKYEVRQLIIIH